MTTIRERLLDDRGIVGGADVLLFGIVGVVFPRWSS